MQNVILGALPADIWMFSIAIWLTHSFIFLFIHQKAVNGSHVSGIIPGVGFCVFLEN